MKKYTGRIFNFKPLLIIFSLLLVGLGVAFIPQNSPSFTDTNNTGLEAVPNAVKQQDTSTRSGSATADNTSDDLQPGYLNPAASYCTQMGYTYETLEDAEGNEYGVCVFPDGSECDAWDFLRGKAGQEYSYCSKQGYDIRTDVIDQGDYITECAVCVTSQTADASGLQLDSLRDTPMLELMKENGDLLGTEISLELKDSDGNMTCGNDVPAQSLYKSDKSLPSSFDWRNYNGHSYIGSVRDQGSCGSCYAFAAAASAEGVYNWASGSYDTNCADFSESFIMWCLARIPEYGSHFYGCDGADYDYMELEALTTHGICDESDFPYTTADPGSCTHWGDPVTTFACWGRIPCNDIDAIKTAIMTYGVIDAAVYVGSSFSDYTGGIYIDSNTECSYSPCYYTPTNHAIALVGWDDNDGDGYWILRNSWGSSWGEGGYMRISYTSAVVACEATYLSSDPLIYTLNISSSGDGSVDSPGIGSFGPYVAGQVIDLSAVPDENYYFSVWSGDTTTIANVSAATTNISMEGNYSIQADFIMYDGPWFTICPMTINDSEGNGNGMLDPGEAVTAHFNTSNTGNANASNTIASLSSSSGYVTIDPVSHDLGTMVPNQSAIVSFNLSVNASTPIGTAVTLNYSVNSGNVSGSTSNLEYVGCEPSIQVGNGSTAAQYPFRTYWMDSRTQSVLLASDIMHAGTIEKVKLYCATRPGQNLENFYIRMQHNTMSSFTSNSFINTGWTTVAHLTDVDVSVWTVPGWVEFNLTTPFEYNGYENLLIDYCVDNSEWTTDGYCLSTSELNRTLTYFYDLPSGDLLSYTTGTLQSWFNNVEFEGCLTPPPVPVNMLNTSSAGNGTVSLPGIGSFGPYYNDQVIDISATADPCYGFVNWTGDIDSIANPNAATTTITMNGSKTIQANFIVTPWDVNCEGAVNVLDMILIGQHWGQTGSPEWIPEDVNGDGTINVLDMILIGQHWTG